MKIIKKYLASAFAVSLVAASPGAFANSIESDQAEALKASSELMEKEAIRLLLFASVLNSRGYDLVEVSPDIEARYNNTRNAVFATLPTSLAVGALFYSANESAEKFESSLRPITLVLRKIAIAVAEAGKASGRFLDAIGVDRLINSSAKSVEASVDLLKPVIKLLVSKGFLVSVGTISMSGVVATSSFLISNSTVEDAVTTSVGGSVARSLLGYDRAVQERVDQLTDDLATVFSMDAKQKSRFKEAFSAEVSRLAIQNDLDPNADYSVDVLKVLNDQKVIPSELALAADALRQMVKMASEQRITQVSEQEKLAHNIDAVIATSVVLEEILNTQKLSREDEKEIALRLINAKKNLELVQLNFKGLD